MTGKLAFMTFLNFNGKIKITFTTVNNKTPTIMRIALINQPDMRLLSIMKKIINNPWVGVIVSLVVIIPCLYEILDDITVLRKEYIVLVISFPIYIRSLKKIFDEILDTSDDFSE